MEQNHDILASTPEADLSQIAFRTLMEWLCCSEFRSRAPLAEVLFGTWLGQAEIKLNEAVGWQWYKTEEGRFLQTTKRRALDLWLESGWVRMERPRLGRPRVTEYSSGTLRKAMSIWNNGCQGFVSDATWSWACSVLGENSNKNKLFVILLPDNVFEELYKRVTLAELEGLTREELAEVLDLPKRLANQFVRYLVDQQGWSVRETTRRGIKCRVLRQFHVKTVSGTQETVY
jgi:hypothetical protein